MGEAPDLLAYCGLYCGDCAGHSGDISEAARSLLDVLERYRFERTAASLFKNEIPDYAGFREALEFVSGLTCPARCRQREDPACCIAKCAIGKRLAGCYECDDFRRCEKLAGLEELHGDSCVRNIESIRKMGPEVWVAEGRRLWFGSDVDEPPSPE
jgi:hypothetical protein